MQHSLSQVLVCCDAGNPSPCLNTGLTGRTEDVTALRSRTTALCAGRGSPPSEQERGSERTAASALWSRGEPFSWQEWYELQKTRRLMSSNTDRYLLKIEKVNHLTTVVTFCCYRGCGPLFRSERAAENTRSDTIWEKILLMPPSLKITRVYCLSQHRTARHGSLPDMWAVQSCRNNGSPVLMLCL